MPGKVQGVGVLRGGAGTRLDRVSPRDVAMSRVSLLFPFLEVGVSSSRCGSRSSVPAVRQLAVEGQIFVIRNSWKMVAYILVQLFPVMIFGCW